MKYIHAAGILLALSFIPAAAQAQIDVRCCDSYMAGKLQPPRVIDLKLNQIELVIPGQIFKVGFATHGTCTGPACDPADPACSTTRFTIDIPPGADYVPEETPAYMPWQLVSAQTLSLIYGGAVGGSVLAAFRVRSLDKLGAIASLEFKLRVEAHSVGEGTSCRDSVSVKLPIVRGPPTLNVTVTSVTKVAGKVSPGERYRYTVTASASEPAAMAVDCALDAASTVAQIIPSSIAGGGQLSGQKVLWTQSGSDTFTAGFDVQVAQEDALPEDVPPRITATAHAAAQFSGGSTLAAQKSQSVELAFTGPRLTGTDATSGRSLTRTVVGDTILYTGENWDPSGPAIKVFWGKRRLKNFKAAATFSGALKLKPWETEDCSGVLRAVQGKTVRVLEIKGYQYALVWGVKGDIRIEGARPAKKGTAICEGEYIPYTDPGQALIVLSLDDRITRYIGLGVYAQTMDGEDIRIEGMFAPSITLNLGSSKRGLRAARPFQDGPTVDVTKYDPIDEPGLQSIPAEEKKLSLQGYGRTEADLQVRRKLKLQDGVLYVNGDLAVGSGGLQGSGSVFALGRVAVAGKVKLAGRDGIGIAAGDMVSLGGRGR